MIPFRRGLMQCWTATPGSIYCTNKTSRLFSTAPISLRRRNEIDFDEPIKFSSSKASQSERPAWMLNPKLLSRNTSPKSQVLSIYFSLVSLLIYFCVLRKENDIDEIIFKNQLYSKVQGLEKQDLTAALNSAVLSSDDSRAIRKRLNEIEAEEREMLAKKTK
eukprot:TRINITY_DN4322_c0_g1_i1.p1 TRINITY_DN4322_c0_g1~~TRINITY_DN4322_c0_g1_i1.p1  ORF type:complete len:162 (+),score=48.63 TRINITY_DN4322_c0_g1_i1:41-526(+)